MSGQRNATSGQEAQLRYTRLGHMSGDVTINEGHDDEHSLPQTTNKQICQTNILCSQYGYQSLKNISDLNQSN